MSGNDFLDLLLVRLGVLLQVHHVARVLKLEGGEGGARALPFGQRRLLKVLVLEVEVFVGVEKHLGDTGVKLVVVSAPVA